MIIKKIFPILAIILVLACVSTVCAEDNQTTDIHKEDTVQHETSIDKTPVKQASNTVKSSSQDKSKIYVSTKGKDSNSGTRSSPKASIKNAVKTVKSGGTIYLADGTYTESGINIKKNLKIVGSSADKTIINSKNKHTITVNAKVSMKSFTIKNAKDKNGGAIYNKGILTLNNIKIVSSSATSSGGAIYNKGRLTASNTIFSKDTAGRGGAIYNANKLTLNKCRFQDNYARIMGSSIYTTSTMKIHSGNFINNRNTAIFIKKNKKAQSIRSSTFKSNSGENGGAIYNQQSTLNIVKTYFGKNSAHRTGGAIYSSGTLNIKSSTFNSNRAKNGGALYNGNVLNFRDNSVKNNAATQTGGAIYDNGKSTIKTSKFHNNHAANGGAVYSKTSRVIRLSVSFSQFTNNVAKKGGALYIHGNTRMDVRSCAFNENHDNAVYLKTGSTKNLVYNSSLTKNYAKRGGAIRNNGGELLLKSNYISGNKATWGGALYNNNGKSTLKFNMILNNGKNDVYNKKSRVTANNNWWGSNSKPGSTRIQNCMINNWIYMTLTSSNTQIKIKDSVTTTVSLNKVYNGKKLISIKPELYNVKLRISVNGGGVSKKLNPTCKGVYKFTTKFTSAGSATITAVINKQKLKNHISIGSNIKNTKMTGIYLQRIYSVSPSIVNGWVKAGITDVFVQAQASSKDTQLLRKTITLCKNTNIRVHAWVICFLNKGGSFDISNSRQEMVKNFIRSTIRINGVSGVNLDYVRYSGANPGNVNPNKITNFVKSVNSIIKGYNKNLIFSACVFAEKADTRKYYGQDYAKLSPYLDILMPMTYKYSYSTGRNWLKSSTKYVVDRAKSSKVVSIIQTYNNNIKKLSSSELEGDAKAVMNGGSYGYVLFRYGLISSYPKSANKL